jgi:quercetin dioxygenase-like cupin family protein
MDAKKEKPHINVDYFEDLTGELPEVEAGDTAAIGDRIKAMREEKGLTLDELSYLTGFDVDRLASIEKKEVQPQLGTVIKLSKALDSAFVRVISGAGNKLYSVTRKGEQKTVQRSTSRKSKKQLYSYRSLAPEVQGRHMEALIVQLEVSPDDEMSVHEGEEFVYVIGGTVVLKIAGEVFDLEEGDSVYYLSTTPHQIAAKSATATILAVLYEG